MALVLSDLPRDYGDVRAEVAACRSHCALFDFSFLERAAIEGPSARDMLEAFAGRSLATLAPGKIRYALRVAPHGALLADLTIWRTGPQTYEVMSGRREDVLDLLRLGAPAHRVADRSAETAVLSLQGPRTLKALDGLGDLRAIAALPYFGFCQARLAGVSCIVGRLGYTGEQGFEIVLARQDRASLWGELAKRAPPAGFAAADTLRIEAGFVLFTNEFAIPVSPSEAGLGRFFNHPEVGLATPLRLVCFRAASEHKLSLWRPPGGLSRPDRAGVIAVTSACESVAADGVLGLGYVAAGGFSGAAVLHDPAGQFRDIEPVSLPFYDARKQRPRQPWSR
jgi:glycine cleavage system aminomethyltransferase T